VNLDVQFGRIKLEIVAADFLGAIHGRVGVGEQHVGVRPVIGIIGEPDAASHLKIVPVDVDRLGDRGSDLLQSRGNDVDVLGLIEEQDNEFIAAEPHHGVARAYPIRHAMGDNFEEFVAGVVAEAVVDEFEIVEVDEYDGHPTIVALRVQHRLRQAILEQRAVRQPGQRIVVGHEMDAVFGKLAFDGDPGDPRGDIDEAGFRRAWFARLFRIHGERAKHRAAMRQDRRRPARAKAMRSRQFPIVGPQRIIGNVGDDDRFPSIGGGTA